MWRRTWAWLDERAGLSALRYPIPPHANTVAYTLGGISFVGFLVLALTGFWLAQFYDPMPDHVRASMEAIRTEAPLAAFVRGIHFWVANIVVVTVVLHILRVFATASFKRPRELNWLAGVALLAITIAFAFTGSVLKWDQEAFEALQHNFEIAGILGGLGVFFSESFTEAVPVLARLYSAHVSILPLLATLLFVAHFFLVKHHGISPLPERADAGAAPGGKVPEAELGARYTGHLGRMVGFGLLAAVAAAVLGLVFPAPLGDVPNPDIEVTKPPFFFYWLYAFEDWFGVQAILYASLAFFTLLAIVPILDRSPLRSLRRRPLVAAGAALVLLVVVALSVYVFFAPVAEHIE
ncbi:MAG: cytochrome b N-terminal domain-containing protein [Chloroflexi bacterium]|nr:cytochrome b N-terminal domain-containing protein [Chloroflexota bacterium]